MVATFPHERSRSAGTVHAGRLAGLIYRIAAKRLAKVCTSPGHRAEM